MEINFLDSSFKEIALVDRFNSLIWTDRYDEAGDFDLSVAPTSKIWQRLATTKYFKIKESEHIMMLESLNLKSNAEDGDELIIKGRSIERILDRRLVWTKILLIGGLQAQIFALLNHNITDNAPIPNRRISNFTLATSSDPRVTDPLIQAEYTNEDYLYDVISDLCRSKDIGFKITLDTGDFVFSLYAGIDRSYEQLKIPTVTFSPKFNNVRSSDYVRTEEFLKTIVLVAGEEGVGNTRVTKIVEREAGITGLNRRELYAQANEVSRNGPSGPITEADYLNLLNEVGLKELRKNNYIQAFDAEVDLSTYSYGVDFNMGDILKIEDKYDNFGSFKVAEMVFAQDRSGIKIYPIFRILENKI